MKKSYVRATFALALSIFAAAAFGQTYRLSVLGELSGVPVMPYGMNDAGIVVGHSPNGTGQAVRSVGSGWEAVGSSEFFSAQAINSSGTIVGSGLIVPEPVFPLPQMGAVVWENGTLRDLGTLGGDSGGGAFDINDAGMIVGTSPTASGANHAFSYENGLMRDLGTLGGDSLARAVNASGEIVGISSLLGSTYPNRAFLYSNGAMRDLGTLAGGDTAASDINASGTVVGYSQSAAGNVLPVVWENGTIRSLDLVAGWQTGGATAINDVGDIVGDLGLADYSDFGTFLYRNGTMIDLNSVVDAGGTGLRLAHIVGINNSGTILAQAYLPGDKYNWYPVVLNPVPEPASLAALGLGAAAVLRRRKRAAGTSSPSRSV